MVKMAEKDWFPVFMELQTHFYNWYFRPLLEILRDNETIKNAKVTKLIDAIQAGTITYKSGVFSGSFNAALSKELSAFATYDKRTKTWKGTPPAIVIGAAVKANDKARDSQRQIKNKIEELDARVKAEVSRIVFDVSHAIGSTVQDTGRDLANMTVVPDITEGQREQLQSQYTENMRLNIVNEFDPSRGNWNDEQVTRLREMIERSVLKGFGRKGLIDSIMGEWDTTRKKAEFLARQETSLFISSLTNERYKSAGLKWYEWLTSSDIRVVGTPGGKYPEGSKGHGNHYAMRGKVCSLTDPTIYADSLEDARKGLWKSKASIGADNRHAGEAFNCRCGKKPILD